MLELWKDFFVASAGASAGLAGLIIVAMSVNIETIVKVPSLPSRAGATIAGLVLIVVVSMAGLIPGFSAGGYGVLALVGAVAAGGFAVDSAVRILRDAGPTGASVVKGAVGLIPAVLVLVGGALLALGSDGLYWVAAGILAAFVTSVLNAWVLLVEIRR